MHRPRPTTARLARRRTAVPGGRAQRRRLRAQQGGVEDAGDAVLGHDAQARLFVEAVALDRHRRGEAVQVLARPRRLLLRLRHRAQEFRDQLRRQQLERAEARRCLDVHDGCALLEQPLSGRTAPDGSPERSARRARTQEERRKRLGERLGRYPSLIGFERRSRGPTTAENETPRRSGALLVAHPSRNYDPAASELAMLLKTTLRLLPT